MWILVFNHLIFGPFNRKHCLKTFVPMESESALNKQALRFFKLEKLTQMEGLQLGVFFNIV